MIVHTIPPPPTLNRGGMHPPPPIPPLYTPLGLLNIINQGEDYISVNTNTNETQLPIPPPPPHKKIRHMPGTRDLELIEH